MCGLIGIYNKKSIVSQNDQQLGDLTAIASSMLDTLASRGPDEKSLIAIGPTLLGHTRLSIIDLQTGSQPIFNEDKSIAVLLNGEIYNYRDLRIQLENKGHIFRSTSDTEVIVHQYEECGENVFSKLNGMFAIVIYDTRKNVFLAARDRIGEKPLIYVDSPETFVVASEIKALLKYSHSPREIDKDALALYLKSMYIPAPLTIFRNFKKLLPSHYIKISKNKTDIKPYWSPTIEIDWTRKENNIIDEFKTIFAKAVKDRIVADVPIGVFLSGGIDSSAVTAFMARCCSTKIKTFSLGFIEDFDERPFARLVADLYQTDHTEILVEDKVEDIFDKVMHYFDEPFGDSSAIPTYLVSREARKHVKVILTGDGGDELFAGYDAYLPQKYQLGGRIKSKLFEEICSIFRFNRNGIFESLYPRSPGKYAEKHWLQTRNIFSDNDLCNLFSTEPRNAKQFFETRKWLAIPSRDALSLAFAHDLNFYLPDDLLKKVDMASMLSSLECRAPFLDHILIEFAMKIPPQLKLKNDIVKYLLKQALKEFLPDEILNRSKHGFGAPVQTWLQKPLRNMTQDYLAPGCCIESLIKREAIISALNAVYKSDKCDNYRTSYKLWLLLVLEIWMRNYYCNHSRQP